MAGEITKNTGGAVKPVDRLKNIINAQSVQEQFRNALGENRGLFVSSLIDIFTTDNYLQKCDPAAVVREALKAATLKLPINKALGYAYIVPYKDTPTFQIGYKGLIQLAQRTGQYRYINADIVYQGEYRGYDKLSGAVDLYGEKTGDEIIGYFAYIETIYGFKKTLFWTKDKVIAHAKKHSKMFSSDKASNVWKSNFDEMALKTVLRNLLTKYGIMTVDMAPAIEHDPDDAYAESETNANVVDMDFEENEGVINSEATEAETSDKGDKKPEWA